MEGDLSDLDRLADRLVAEVTTVHDDGFHLSSTIPDWWHEATADEPGANGALARALSRNARRLGTRGVAHRRGRRKSAAAQPGDPPRRG
ncbi:hypothetical protein [uncultured Pseudokineococcus sp.]|uniref:hypothetical protein n=1 Tax=uncultured Pseudokineococcus sp. TaxID=1642928 RepID=UPI002621A07E|nr:hypothetical protein [uncultured Pseudokineococcus sp.]